MYYDDIIIGAGLSALAVAVGLRGGNRRILVLAGSDSGFRYYPGASTPAAYAGRGGMGGYWHGVIPLSLQFRPEGLDDKSWARLAHYFYPTASLADHIGRDQYFVPRRPIRPASYLAQFARMGEIEMTDIDATRIELESDGSQRIFTADDDFRGRRIWMCAGALGTPGVLARSGLIASGERAVSDHIIGYAGQIRRDDASATLMSSVRRDRDGVFFPFRFSKTRDHFFSLRPARFDFAKIDAGITKRAVFGLPTNRIVSGLLGNASPGLVAEALFNKFGLFAQAALYSVYFQTMATDAYILHDDGNISPSFDIDVRDAIASAHASIPFADIARTNHPDLYIPGIHLHGSLTRAECEHFGSASELRNIHLVDAATLRGIGPEHHSFAMMAAAYRRAIVVAIQD